MQTKAEKRRGALNRMGWTRAQRPQDTSIKLDAAALLETAAHGTDAEVLAMIREAEASRERRGRMR